MSRSKRTAFRAVPLATVAWTCGLALAAANPPHLSEPPPQDPMRLDNHQTLVRRLEGNPRTLNPLFRASGPEYAVLELLYDAPFVFDAQMRWQLNSAVAESYQESDDHLSATLVLKTGLTWHDGKPFTAHDVAFSYAQLSDTQVPAGANRSGLELLTSCTAVSDHEVRFTFREASPVTRVSIAFPIIARHVFNSIKTTDATLASGPAVQANRNPVGNGPYRFVEWRDDEHIVLERWEDYTGSAAHFKRIVFRIVRDPKAALLALRKGELDEMRLTPAQFAAQTASEGFAKVAVTARGDQWVTNYIGWNMDGRNPFFGDARVRQAMSHAFDAEQILQNVYQGAYSRSTGIYPPGAWMFNPQIKAQHHSLADAGDLLDQAGWKIDPESGWRTKGEITFAFELLCPQESSTGRQTLTYYQQALRSIGVDMKLRLIEYATLLDLRRRHEFQAYYGAWTTSADPDQDRGMWHSRAISDGANFISYRNSRVDALFDRARRSFDYHERRQCYQQIHRLIYEDQPFTFVSVSPSLWAFNKHLRGVGFGPRGVFYWHPGPRNWWVQRGTSLRAP